MREGHNVAPIDLDSSFRKDVVAGLARRPKSLPCKYFYDARGAELFDRICELPAYYPTRTEAAIMRCHAREMASLLGKRISLVELGSGSSAKTRILLSELREPDSYVPVDISADYLQPAVNALASEFPDLAILPVCADYSRRFAVPRRSGATRTVAYFPGSTIGNFQPSEARQFLSRIALLAGPGGGLLIGVDLKKDRSIIENAYNDPEGVTAEFNCNLLRRINRELAGTFDVAAFRHRAFYDPQEGRIEMQLVSMVRQAAYAAGVSFEFAEGETICTEYSYKYSIVEFQKVAREAGFTPNRVWTDEQNLFSVHYLVVM